MNILFSLQAETRPEQESFLTLLNTGMAGTIQQEVVATSTIAPPQTGVSTNHQMIPSVGATQMASTSMVPDVSDGSQIMTTTEPTTQIVFTSQELVQTSQEVVPASQELSQTTHELDAASQVLIPVTYHTSATQNKGQRKVHRIGLVCKMKNLTRELLDYSLLVKDTSLLESFVGDLEAMVMKANTNATLDPSIVQKELARNRKKRAGGPPVFSSVDNKRFRLSDIL